jgi:hypothetical protein
MCFIQDGSPHLIYMHLLDLLRAHRTQLGTHGCLAIIFADLHTSIIDLQGDLMVLVDDVIKD